MGKKGLEPPTLRLSGVYSYHLSYLPEKEEIKPVFPYPPSGLTSPALTL
jgi:hypothetical protein